MGLFAEIRRCQRLEKAKLAAWRLGDRRPLVVSHRVRVFRGREHRYTPVKAASGSTGSDDPHIDGAPPVAVANVAALEVAYV